MRGYFGIGVINGKSAVNIGTLWRTAKIFGASFIFTINKRYPVQVTDTLKTPRHVPLFHYESFDSFVSAMPFECDLIGVELTNSATEISDFKHPERAVYLLGAEDRGVPNEYLKACKKVIKLPGEFSLNVSVAGSIVLYDRLTKIK